MTQVDPYHCARLRVFTLSPCCDILSHQPETQSHIVTDEPTSAIRCQSEY